MDIISRLKQFMEYRQLSSSQVADTAGIPRPTLSLLLNGRKKSNNGDSDATTEGAKKISSDIIRKLHDAFPSLNVMWLLFGDGDMEDNSNIEISEAQNTEKTESLQPHNSDYEPFNRLDLFDDEDSDLHSEKLKSVAEPQNRQINAQSAPESGVKSTPTFSAPQPIAVQPDKTKRVISIMVFYSDNSFETFKPAD